MGFKDTLKGSYTKLEDYYYTFLEKTGLYKLVDPLEAKGIRSFPIALGLAAVILAALLVGIYFLVSPGEIDITLIVLDQENYPIEGAQISYEGEKAYTDEQGKAVIGVKKGELFLDVNATGYQAKTRTIIAVAGLEETVYLEIAVLEIATDVTLYLKNSAGASLDGKNTRLEFYCTSGAEPPAAIDTTKWVVTVTKPADCGTFMVEGTVAGFQEGSWPIKTNSEILSFSPVELPKTDVLVTVTANEDPLKGIEVVMSARGEEIAHSNTNDSGVATFRNVTLGDYDFTASDLGGVYASNSASKTIREVSNSVFIDLSKTPIGSIKVRVMDANGPVDTASVVLYSAVDSGDVKANRRMGSAKPIEGVASFAVTENIEYYLMVSEPNYMAVVKTGVTLAKYGVSPLSVMLEPCTQENCATAIVRVRDIEGKPIQGAMTYLYDSRENNKVNDLGQPTGMDGTASFLNIAEGEYYAKSYKSTLATSDSMYVAAGDIGILNIVIEVGEGAVAMNITDEDKQPIPFASISFYSSVDRAKLLETETDGEGVLAPKTFTAGEKVYAVVSTQGYATYTSAPIDIIAGEITYKNIAMMRYDPQVDVTDVPSIRFLGTFFEDNKLETIDGGVFKKVLELRYEVFVPQSYSEVKAMVRVGLDSSPTIEFDPVVIKDALVSEAFVMKGATWTPPTGDENDLGEGITTADAKWTLARFDAPRIGAYEMIVQVKLNELASQIPAETHYRVEAKKADKILRSPEDQALGTEENTEEKHGLYANTLDKDLIMGVISMCDETQGFCYSVKVEDLVEGMESSIVTEKEKYTAIVNAGYILKVDLSNTGLVTRPAAKLNVYEPNSRVLDFERYSVIDPLTQEKTGEPPINRFEEPVGDFGPNESLSFKLWFRPRTSSPTIMRFELQSGKEIVFAKNVNIEVSSGKKMALRVLPGIINSATDTTLEINVVEATKGAPSFPIHNAQIDVTTNDEFPPYKTTFTDVNGNTQVELVKQLPETKVTVTASKETYVTARKIIMIDANLLTPIPEVIEPLFVVGGERRKTTLVDLTNNTGMDFVIVGMQVTGNALMKQFIDWDPEDYTRYNGLSIPKEQRTQIEIVLSAKKGLVGVPKGQMIGSIDIRVLNPASQHEFITKIPVLPELRKMGEAPKEGCILVEIREGEWRLTSVGEPAQVEIMITNVCEDAATGIGINAHNLKASLKWQGRKIGDVKLMIDAIAPILRQRPRVVKSLLQYDEPVTAILEYIPMGTGKAVEGSAELVFSAEVDTDKGPKDIPATVIGIDFSYNNLKDCIAFQGIDPALRRVEIARVGEYGRITVDASECDLTTQSIGVRMVAPLEGTDIKPDNYFVLDMANPSQELRVGSTSYAGIMPIFVDLIPNGDETQTVRLVDPIEIIVKRNIATRDAFVLRRFHFNASVAPDYAEFVERKFWKTLVVELNVTEMPTAMDTMLTVLGTTASFAAAGAGIGFIWGPVGAAIGAAIGAVAGFIVGWILALLPPEDEYEDVKYPAYPMEEAYNVSNNLDVLAAPDDTYGYEFVGDEDLIPDDYIYGRARGIKFYDDPDYDGINYGILTISGKRYFYETDEVDYAPRTFFTCAHKAVSCTSDGRCITQEFCDEHMGHEVTGTSDISSIFYIRVDGDIQPYRRDFENLDAEFCYGANGEQGITGFDVAPRLDYDWQWKSIPYNFCEPEEEDGFGYYCDATQFSIALLQRLHVLDEFLKQNDLQCPLTTGDLEELQEFVDVPGVGVQPAQGDIGIVTPIERTTSPQNLTIINAHIKNNLGASVTGTVTTSISVYGSSDPPLECVSTKTFSAGATETVSCYKTLQRNESYRAVVTLDLSGASCPNDNCGNPDNDTAMLGFMLIGSQETDCVVPLTLATLPDFIDATPDVRYSIDLGPEFSTLEFYSREEIVTELLSFKAYLMPDDFDGAGGDFRADFDRHYGQETLEAPDYYKNEMVGLKNYFIDTSKLRIINKYTTGGTYDPLRARIGSPGLYEIVIKPWIDIGYNKLFSGGAPTGTIDVVFNKINSPGVDSAFYYLPFDGSLGLTTDSEGNHVLARNGYGTDFTPESEPLTISDELTEFITGMPSEEEGRALFTVTAHNEIDFAVLNEVEGGSEDERGKVLRMKPAPGGGVSNITFYPTFAVPLMLQMNETTSMKYFIRKGLTDADAEAVDKGPSEWIPIGAKDCSDVNFDSIEITETGSGGNYTVTAPYPDLYAKTMFYVPVVEITNYYLGNSDPQNPAKLVLSDGIPQNQASLTGLPGVTPVISSLEEVFDNIRARKICMYTKPDGTNLFFWNPRMLYQELHEATIPLEGMQLCDVCGDYICEGNEFLDCPDDCATDLSNFSRAHPNINRIENSLPPEPEEIEEVE